MEMKLERSSLVLINTIEKKGCNRSRVKITSTSRRLDMFRHWLRGGGVGAGESAVMNGDWWGEVMKTAA
jgi:hypothetical protein